MTRQQRILRRADRRAQRRFREMIEARAYGQPYDVRTRLYVQAERLIDDLSWTESENRLRWGDRVTTGVRCEVMIRRNFYCASTATYICSRVDAIRDWQYRCTVHADYLKAN